MKCTWNSSKDGECKEEATFPQIGEDGRQWANLCKEHDELLNSAFEPFDVKRTLSYWVQASGGPKKMAETR